MDGLYGKSERHERRGLTRMAVGLCLVMLAAVMGTLAWRLMPRDDYAAPLGSDATMGMVLIDITDEDAASYYHVTNLGVYVLAVDESSAAYLAGVRSGDRIVSLNGVQVSQSAEFEALRDALEPGAAMELSLEREGAQAHVIVTLANETGALL